MFKSQEIIERKVEEQTMQWPNDKGQAMQWPNDKGQTMQWPSDKGQKYIGQVIKDRQYNGEMKETKRSTVKLCPIPFNVFK